MKILPTAVLFATMSLILFAQESSSIRGKVALPKDIPEWIQADGLSMDKAIVMIEGKYNHPRRPYPADWSSKTVEERGAWSSAFRNSDAYEEYEKKVEAARAKRLVRTAEIGKDGSFVFEDVKLGWYQLSAMIMHDKTEERGENLARGYALRQFFVRDAKKPAQMGTLRLKLKNVLMAGDVAPPWTATAYDDSEFALKDFRGKYVLFDIWATWCGPCKAEIPNLEKTYEKFGGDRFEMVGLSIDKAIDLPKTFLKRQPSPYRQGFLGSGDHYEKIADAYGINSVPAIWLIGPDGKIIARDLHGKALVEAVRKALAE